MKQPSSNVESSLSDVGLVRFSDISVHQDGDLTAARRRLLEALEEAERSHAGFQSSL
jgi:hypothetical protein